MAESVMEPAAPTARTMLCYLSPLLSQDHAGCVHPSQLLIHPLLTPESLAWRTQSNSRIGLTPRLSSEKKITFQVRLVLVKGREPTQEGLEAPGGVRHVSKMPPGEFDLMLNTQSPKEGYMGHCISWDNL
jgi:hypothetical protein